MIRTYDETVARQEFDHYTYQWRQCPPEGLRRIRHQIVEIAKLLPLNDPRHLTVSEILETIAKGDTQ